MNNKVQQLVHDRLSDSGAVAPLSSIPMTFRIDPSYLAQLDVIAEYLGYRGRSGLVRDLVESQVEDLILETLQALESDPLTSDQFKARIREALGSADSVC